MQLESSSYGCDLMRDDMNRQKILLLKKGEKLGMVDKIYRSLILLPHKFVTTQLRCPICNLCEHTITMSNI